MHSFLYYFFLPQRTQRNDTFADFAPSLLALCGKNKNVKNFF